MKRIVITLLILCLSLTLSYVCQAEDGSFVRCGTIGKIYANLSKKNTFNITVSAQDGCSGENSRLILRDARGGEVTAINVPDESPPFVGQAIHVTFSVAPGESIWFECIGGGDDICSFTMVDISLGRR